MERGLRKYASPNLRKDIDNKYPNGVPEFNALGSVKEYQGIQSANISPKSADLEVKVRFDLDEAYIDMKLVNNNGKWLLDDFKVDCPRLYEKIPAVLMPINIASLRKRWSGGLIDLF